MKDEEKQAEKEYQKKYYKKLKACKDDLWPEKQKEVKKRQIITSKKRSKCKNMSKIKRNKIKSNLNGYNFAFAQYKMSLKFGEIKLNKKEFHRSRQPIYLNQVGISKTVMSDELKLDDGVKNGETVKPLDGWICQIF